MFHNHRIQLIIIALNQVNLRIYRLVPAMRSHSRKSKEYVAGVYTRAYVRICTMVSAE